MIHSMSGGVIADNGIYLFAKVRVAGEPRWYLAPFGVAAGDKVEVPFGRDGSLAAGDVERVETCTAQTAPCPMRSVKRIVRVLSSENR